MTRVLAVLAAVSMAGCGAGEVTEDGAVAAGQDELTATAQLLGSYKAIDGTLLGLVLAKDGAKKMFVAEQQIWCVRAPCYPLHLEGSWAIRLGKIYLTEGGNKHIYEYTVGNGALTLSDPATHKPTNHLSRVETWCAKTADCGLQGYNRLKCMGGDICTAAQTCGSFCGGLPYPGGYGDACSATGCYSGLTCEASGVCMPLPGCDLTSDRSCGDAKVCTAGTDGLGTCQDFAHAVTVGKGYSCGGSIGVDCAKGLSCLGLPAGRVGGTGTCG